MPRSHRHSHRRRDVPDDIGDISHIIRGFVKRDGAEGHDSRDKIAGRDQATVVQVVYKTLAPTFDGPIAGYSTLHEGVSPSPTKAPQKQPSPTPTPPSQSKSSSAGVSKPATTIPSAIHSPDATASADTVLAKATGSPPPSLALSSNGHITSNGLLSSSSATDSASSSNSDGTDLGTSAGTKAGIAFGVLGGVAVVGLIVFLIFSRRRRESQRRQVGEDNEKLPGAAGGAPEPIDELSVHHSNPRAPRISLRPVTQFFPNLNLEKRNSKGAAMTLDTTDTDTATTTTTTTAAAAVGVAVGVAVSGDSPDRPHTSLSSHPANPFGYQAERIPTPISEEQHERAPTPISKEDNAQSPTSPSSSFMSEKTLAREPSMNNETAATTGFVAGAVTAVVAGAAATGGAVMLTRKTSMRNRNPDNVDLTMSTELGPLPPSPVGTEFSVSSAPGPTSFASKSAAAIAAAGGPTNSTVHRVQLNFKPTLEDEMELKAGELIRLLHEYDDGWALVIKLDRSQQGVVPRTCLSTRPVKPRLAHGRPPVNPSGPPRGPLPPPGQRPMTPQSQRPMTPQGQPMMAPQGQRPMTPQGMQVNGRPASPSQSRMGPSQSVGRPQSPMARPMSLASCPTSPALSKPQGPISERPQTSDGRPRTPIGMNQSTNVPRPSAMNPEQPPPQRPPTGLIGRKPVPGQAL